MNSQDELSGLKKDIESLKRDVAIKEGERNSILDRIKKDFKVKNFDEAYKKLEEFNSDIEVKRERRDELIKIAKEKLSGYKK